MHLTKGHQCAFVGSLFWHAFNQSQEGSASAAPETQSLRHGLASLHASNAEIHAAHYAVHCQPVDYHQLLHTYYSWARNVTEGIEYSEAIYQRKTALREVQPLPVAIHYMVHTLLGALDGYYEALTETGACAIQESEQLGWQAASYEFDCEASVDMDALPTPAHLHLARHYAVRAKQSLLRKDDSVYHREMHQCWRAAEASMCEYMQEATRIVTAPAPSETDSDSSDSSESVDLGAKEALFKARNYAHLAQGMAADAVTFQGHAQRCRDRDRLSEAAEAWDKAADWMVKACRSAREGIEQYNEERGDWSGDESGMLEDWSSENYEVLASHNARLAALLEQCTTTATTTAQSDAGAAELAVLRGWQVALLREEIKQDEDLYASMHTRCRNNLQRLQELLTQRASALKLGCKEDTTPAPDLARLVPLVIKYSEVQLRVQAFGNLSGLDWDARSMLSTMHVDVKDLLTTTTSSTEAWRILSIRTRLCSMEAHLQHRTQSADLLIAAETFIADSYDAKGSMRDALLMVAHRLTQHALTQDELQACGLDALQCADPLGWELDVEEDVQPMVEALIASTQLSQHIREVPAGPVPGSGASLQRVRTCAQEAYALLIKQARQLLQLRLTVSTKQSKTVVAAKAREVQSYQQSAEWYAWAAEMLEQGKEEVSRCWERAARYVVEQGRKVIALHSKFTERKEHLAEAIAFNRDIAVVNAWRRSADLTEVALQLEGHHIAGHEEVELTESTADAWAQLAEAWEVHHGELAQLCAALLAQYGILEACLDQALIERQGRSASAGQGEETKTSCPPVTSPAGGRSEAQQDFSAEAAGRARAEVAALKIKIAAAKRKRPAHPLLHSVLLPKLTSPIGSAGGVGEPKESEASRSKKAQRTK